MSQKSPKQIFITGTDTGVGKTIISTILTAGMPAIYWKPVQCGIAEQTDREFVCEKTGLSGKYFPPETYCLSKPLSPHAAAKEDGVEIDLRRFRLPKVLAEQALIVEGAGGVMVPLNKDAFMIDLMKMLNLPVLLVARSTLGTLNHTLLTLTVLRSYGLTILGVVLNGPLNSSNKEAIEHFGKVRVLAEIPPILDLKSADFSLMFKRYFPKGT